MSTVASLVTPWAGCALGMTAWFVTTYKRSGVVSVATSGESQNAIAGGATGFASGAVLSAVLTLLFPKQYQSTDPQHVARKHKVFGTAPSPDLHGEVELDQTPRESSPASGTKSEVKGQLAPVTNVEAAHDVVGFLSENNIKPLHHATYLKAFRLALGANVFFFIVGVIIFPFTLFGIHYTASRSFFTGWLVVSFMWVWITMGICVIWPITESRTELALIFRGIVGQFRR